MTDVRVTIGMPVYNGERFVEEALHSLLAQDYESFRLVVSDNGSTDRTPEIVAAVAGSDPRVEFERHDENRGAAWNFNRVVRAADTEYFKWAAADDVYEPSFLSRCVDALDEFPDVVLAHAQTVDIDETGAVIHKWGPMPFAWQDDPADRFADLVRRIRKGFPVFGVMRREVLLETGLHGDYPGCDLVLLGELALRGRFFEVPEALFLHREHRDRSMNRYERERSRAVWFDTSKEGAITLPRWRRAAEYVRAARAVPLDGRQRRTAYRAVASWANQNRRWLAWNLGGAARDHALRLLGRLPRRASAG